MDSYLKRIMIRHLERQRRVYNLLLRQPTKYKLPVSDRELEIALIDINLLLERVRDERTEYN